MLVGGTQIKAQALKFSNDMKTFYLTDIPFENKLKVKSDLQCDQYTPAQANELILNVTGRHRRNGW